MAPMLKSNSGEFFETINPATGEVIEQIGQASLKDVEGAIESAERGFAIWSSMTAVERSRILLKAVSILRERNDELAALEVLDTGKPLQEANCVDIHSGADVIEYYAGLVPALQGTQQDLDVNTFFLSKRESFRSLCRDWSLELPYSDSLLEICTLSCSWKFDGF